MAAPPKKKEETIVGIDVSIGAFKADETLRFEKTRRDKSKKHEKTKKTEKSERKSRSKTKFFHGIMPSGKFIDEVYLEKKDADLEKCRDHLKQFKVDRMKRILKASKIVHRVLLSMAGPEWFQELSPRQKEVIDSLQENIKKDLNTHLTGCTQSCLSLLGLRPLPNDKQLWNALIKSFGCPIEFLLIMFNTMRHTDYYTINDRLLLSGVVHLGLTDMLREMHVRLPSPPRPVKVVPPAPPKPPKKKYASVYLIPYTFQWHKRKPVPYRNPNLLKPESPYFSYMCDFKRLSRMCYRRSMQTDRLDENEKMPCELFYDHLEAEKYYNFLFNRDENSKCKYAILRPSIYISKVPKTYPGILPKYMIPKKYPPAFQLIFDVKIYNEINPASRRVRKLLRATCEAKALPSGRPGQQLGDALNKYEFVANLSRYLEEPLAMVDYDIEYLNRPCIICADSEEETNRYEYKPKKSNSFIKRPRIKKTKLVKVHGSFTEFMRAEYERNNADAEKSLNKEFMNEEAEKIIEENKIYTAAWKQFFEQIDKLEELRLETAECACPDKTKHKESFECKCAVWNLPTPPKEVTPKISCECKPEEETVPFEPIQDTCDCRKKALEKALEACEACGVPRPKTKEQIEAKGTCSCTKNLKGCGYCAKQLPMKFPKLSVLDFLKTGDEVEEQKACDCKNKPVEEGQEFTVGYVFVDNDNPVKKKMCSCRMKKDSKSLSNRECAPIPEKPSKQDVECLIACGKILALDHCQKETEKLLNYLKCSCPECKDMRRRTHTKFIQASTKDTCTGLLPIIGGTFATEKECDCLARFEKKIKGVADYKRRMKAKLDLKSQKDSYIVGGVQQTKTGPVYAIGGVLPKKNRECDICRINAENKRKQEKLPEKLQKGMRYEIAGVKEGEEGNEYVLHGATKECKCPDMYTNFIEKHNECLVKYEKYLEYTRKEIEAYMEDMKERYKNPPLTGQKLIDYELKKMFPELYLPEGKKEFVISGITVNDQGKSFILGGTLLDKEEKTLAIESYTHLPEKEASKCQRTYLCNYMTFGKNCSSPFKPTKETELINCSDELICQCISYDSFDEVEAVSENVEEEEEVEKLGCACECPCGEPIERPSDCSCSKEPYKDPCLCEELAEEESEEIESPDGCTCGNIEIASSGTASDPCLCHVKNCGCQIDDICVKECFYGPMEAWWSDSDFREEERKKAKEMLAMQPVEHVLPPFGGPSKRYIILRSIPKNKNVQKMMVKRLLEGLAEDGFPIAQLPNCHKLPHFKLWMQFRSKVRWTRDDALKNLRHCRLLWNHIELCKREVRVPTLPGQCTCNLNEFSWGDAKAVKALIRRTKERYYARVRRNLVNFAREFYPSVYPYQFTNSANLNNYFFAYQPDKVENVIAEYVWQTHEIKDLRERKSCLC